MSLRTSWQQKLLGGMAGILLLGTGLWLTPHLARSQDNPIVAAQADQRLATLQQQAGPDLVTAYRTTAGSSETPPLRFLGASKDHPIPVTPDGAPINAAASEPEQVARTFLRQYGDLFGVQNEASDLHTTRTWSVADETSGARNFARFQQQYQGIPVIGGDFTVQSTPRGILSAGGRILTAAQLHGLASVVPQLTDAAAQQVALSAVAKMDQINSAKLTVTAPTLAIYHPSIFQSPIKLPRLVWQMVVSDGASGQIAEFVLVDAQRGGVALHFNQREGILSRTVYDNHNDPTIALPGNNPVRREGEPATGSREVDLAYEHVGKAYAYYKSTFGRDSVDGQGKALDITVRYCDSDQSCPMANAYGVYNQFAFGDGFAQADDVVAHEFTHGVTDFESALFYYMQSGAIDEALSDIFGEYADLTNGVGNDTQAVRWQIGEDLPTGPLRDMRRPALGMQPDSMTSAYYQCSSFDDDRGGVHTNSGVANQAAFLMTDGGALNGVTVQGLGITKAEHIWYETATNLLNSASDYQDLSNALPQACTNLVGAYGISASDCQQVHKAVQATQMAQPPRSCTPPEAAICPAGQQPSYLFQDDLETPASAKWQVVTLAGATTLYYPQSTNPYFPDTLYATSGRNSILGLDEDVLSDGVVQMAKDIRLPAGSTPYLRFNHTYEFEQAPYPHIGADGGLLEYSTDQGATWQAFDGLAADNGYNGTIATAYDNPLAGRHAFIGLTYGYGSSRFNLAPLAGQQVRVRFRMATDTGNTWGGTGWFIDDIGLYTCSTGEPSEPPAQRASITLDVAPDSAANFHFDSSFGPFTLDDPAQPDTDAYSNTKNIVLPAGEYTVTAHATTKWQLSAINCTPSNAAVVSLNERTVTLNTSVGDVACTFTQQHKASILARSYHDRNGSGTKNSSEPMLPGWTITVSSPLLAEPLQQVTNTLGKANFTQLVPGSYTVCQVKQEGWVNTQPGGSLPCRTITLKPGFKTRVYFGNQQSALQLNPISLPPIDEVFSEAETDDIGEEEAGWVGANDWSQLDLTAPDAYFTNLGATEPGAVELNQKIYLPVIKSSAN